MNQESSFDTFTPSEGVIKALSQQLERASGKSYKTPADCYSVKSKSGVAMFVEPINAAPFVFVSPSTVFQFNYERSSGSDHLRKRILAGVFYESVLVADAHRMRNEAIKADAQQESPSQDRQRG